MDCLFVLPVSLLLLLALECSDADVRDTRLMRALIALVVITFASSALQLSPVGLGVILGMHVRTA